MNTTTVGVDLAKYSFSVCQVDSHGRVLSRRDFRREAFAAWLVQLPAGTIVAMEAVRTIGHAGALSWDCNRA